MLCKLTNLTVVKNKVAPPFKRAEFDIMFGEGISKSGEIIDLGVDNDIIQKSGSWFSYNGMKIAQGRDAAKRVIQDNPELADELEAKIMEALRNKENASGKKADKKPAKAAAPKAAPDEATADDINALDDIPLNDDGSLPLPDDFSIEEDI